MVICALHRALWLALLCGMAAGQGGDDDINALLASYSAAYNAQVGQADADSTRAVHATDADWNAASPGLPPAAESYASVLDQAESAPSPPKPAKHPKHRDVGEASHLRALESQVEEEPGQMVGLKELNTYYFGGKLSDKQLDKLEGWMKKNNMPSNKPSNSHELGESAGLEEEAPVEYRIADLHYAVMSLFPN